MGFFVYILRSRRDRSLYVGHTAEFLRRLAQHNNPSRGCYTSRRGPWDLVHTEEFPDRSSAMKRERFLKSVEGSREKKRLAGVEIVPAEEPVDRSRQIHLNRLRDAAQLG
jgi:putative endonuclease